MSRSPNPCKIVDAARKDSANKKLQKMEKKAETGGERPVKKDGAPKPKGKAKAKAKACQPNDNEPGEPAAAAAAPAAPAAPAAAAAPAARPPAVVAEPEFLTNIGDSWEEVVAKLYKSNREFWIMWGIRKAAFDSLYTR